MSWKDGILNDGKNENVLMVNYKCPDCGTKLCVYIDEYFRHQYYYCNSCGLENDSLDLV